ncbi:KamA family radical SAM protein [Methanocella conradii]|uniref:KamA family radical SAM protein n=1 Tax=Methanocella conradii TaxID=1175444 RepID=UPI001C2CF9CF|nr:KamA family radical SAM protein [Methanocella conradii]
MSNIGTIKEHIHINEYTHKGFVSKAGIVTKSKEDLLEEMWLEGHYIKKMLASAKSLHEARDLFFDHLNDLERHYFNVYSDKHYKNLHIIEKNNAKECIRVLKNVIRTENEHLTGFSALKVLYNLAKDKKGALARVKEGFLAEFIYLFRGIYGKSDIFCDSLYDSGATSDRVQASSIRSQQLDNYSMKMRQYFRRYKTGLDPEVIKRRDELKHDILSYFGASIEDWRDVSWQMSRIIKDVKTLSALVTLDKDEISALRYAEKNRIPFQITPYYLSLFNKDGKSDDDRAVRAQVLPSKRYCKRIAINRRYGADLDFMGEKWTSPIDGITRRYPQILILKPYDSCPQICVYCQRNWEIKCLDEAKVTKEKVKKAIDWIRENENITEVLVTGGDPLTLNDRYIGWLMDEVASIGHVERIRIGTRVLVTMPFRIGDRLIEILKKYHEPGRREVCIVTHFEHPMEMTPDSLEAIQKIRKAGMSVYNQQVFTYYNSRKFETVFLRKVLKVCGVDPYYTFNTKGKEETIDFRVPIARIEQERKRRHGFFRGS